MDDLLKHAVLDSDGRSHAEQGAADPSERQPPTRTVFSGRFSRAFLFEAPGPGLIVRFSHWIPGRAAFDEPKLNRFYSEFGLSQLQIQTAANDWFLNADLLPLLTACAEAAKPYANVTCYGSSMGGYGAMIFSARLRANRVVLLSPQVSIDPKKVPFETRWLKDAAKIDFNHERLGGRIAKDAQGFIIYDPSVPHDTQHVARILSMAPRWRAIPLWNGQHPATQVITEGQMFREFGEELLRPDPRTEQLLLLHRKARHQSASYWHSLIERTLVKRPDVAQAALQRAMRCGMVNTPTITAFKLGQRAHRAALPRGADLMDTMMNRPDGQTRWGKLVRKALRRKAARLQERITELERRNRELDNTVKRLQNLTKQYRVTSPIWWYRAIKSVLVPRKPDPPAPVPEQ